MFILLKLIRDVTIVIEVKYELLYFSNETQNNNIDESDTQLMNYIQKP